MNPPISLPFSCTLTQFRAVLFFILAFATADALLAQTNWIVRRGGGTPYHLGGVAYGEVNGQPVFVAVSGPEINNGILTPFALTSPDGITWTQRQIDGTAPAIFNSVAFQNGRFVAVGWNSAGAVTAHSDDGGVTWTRQSSVFGGVLNDVAPGYNGGWVAVGGLGSLGVIANGAVVTSPTGTGNWTLATVNVAVELHGVVQAGDKTIAVGTQGFMFESDQGGAWQQLPTIVADPLYDVTYREQNGLATLIAAGQNGRVLLSTNFGANWSIRPPATATIIYDIAWNEDVFVGVGFGGIFVYSYDNGLSWTQLGPTFPADNFYGATHGFASSGQGRFVAVGTLERILSTDTTNAPPSGGNITVTVDPGATNLTWMGGDRQLTLHNSGGSDATVPVSSSDFWITIFNPSVMVPAGGSAEVDFRVATNLGVAERTGSIQVDSAQAVTVFQGGSPPGRPTVFQTLIGPNAITGNWSQVTGATGYIVEKEVDENNWVLADRLPGTATTYVATGLPSWTDQFFRLIATNFSGNSLPSLPFGGRTPPAAPAMNVQVDGWSQTTITWTDVPGGGSYALDYKVGEGNWMSVANAGVSASIFPAGLQAYTHAGLAPDSDVSYRIRAYGQPPHENRASPYSETTVHLPPYNGVIYWGDHEIESLPFGQDDLYDVVNGDGRYVAVGANGTILSSPDGSSWTAESSGTTALLRGIAFGNGMFVAIGTNGTILTSPGNGTWSERASGQPVLTGGIAFGNGRFVATLPGNSILLSTNGSDWSPHPTGGTAQNFGSIGFGNGEFLIGLLNGEIRNSPDGINWSQSRPGTNEFSQFSFAWNGSLWVAGSSLGRVCTSINGQDWTNVVAQPPVSIIDLATDGAVFSGISSGLGGYLGYVSSTDGVHWQTNGAGLYVAALPRAITYGPNGFVAVGAGGSISLSTDGSTWSEIRSYQSRNAIQFTSLAVSGETVVLSGVPPAPDVHPRDGFFWARNPVTGTWTNLTSILPTNGAVGRVSTIDGEFFAAGGSAAGALVLRSVDGLNWNITVVPGAPGFNEIARGNGRYVAVAGGQYVFTSIDAETWTTNGVTTDFVSISANLREVKFVDGRFYTLGVNSPVGMHVSSNGLTWQPLFVNQPSGFAAGRAFGRRLFLALGPVAHYLSTDGLNWKGREDLKFGLTAAHGNGVFVAHGSFEGTLSPNQVFASLDGVIWEPPPVGYFPPFTAVGRWVFANGEFLGIGPDMTFHRIEVSSQPLDAEDSDGIADTVEDAAPNGGDGNLDGVPDRQQPHVASLPGLGGTYLTLVAPPGMDLMNVSLVPNPSPGNPPADAQFPLGFLSFAIGGLTPGAAVSVDLLYPATVAVNAYYKFGGEPGNETPHWYDFAFNGMTGAQFMSPGHVRLNFVDGLRGDDDLSANGTLIDDGGLALVIPALPGLEVTATATNSVIVSWPSPSDGWVLQQTSSLAPSDWTTPSEPVVDEGDRRFIVVESPDDARFYRLFKAGE